MTSSARAITGAVRFLALMISSTSSGVMSLTGRSPHAVTKAARKSRSASLPRRSSANLLVKKACATLAKECLTRSARSRAAASCASASITLGSIPLAISERHSPAVLRAASRLVAP